MAQEVAILQTTPYGPQASAANNYVNYDHGLTKTTTLSAYYLVTIAPTYL